MPDRTDLTYAYDGSFEGLMSCIFESYERKEIPSIIRPPSVQQTLFDTAKWIETKKQYAISRQKVISLRALFGFQYTVRCL